MSCVNCDAKDKVIMGLQCLQNIAQRAQDEANNHAAYLNNLQINSVVRDQRTEIDNLKAELAEAKTKIEEITRDRDGYKSAVVLFKVPTSLNRKG